MISHLETHLALPDVPAFVRERWSRPVALPTVYKWAQVGLRGQRLETLKVSRRLYTSHEALARFFARVADSPFRTPEPKARGMSPAEAAALVR